MPPPPPQSPTFAWAPAKLGTAPTVADGSTVPRELLELAKQLALVEHQRQQLVLKTHGPSTPLASSVHQRRPSSPATTILTPLPASPSKPVSLGLAPVLVVSDVVVCDVCAAELSSAPHLRTHKTSSCPLRMVSCPRVGCGASFIACERVTHDRDACVARRRTQQLLDDHAQAHALVACHSCQELVAVRFMDGHKKSHCAKREISCQYESFGCWEKFPFDQREAHETQRCRVGLHRAKILSDAALVNAEIACDWCDQSVLKRKLLDHQEDACPKRERPCPNAANGCPEWVPVEGVPLHLQNDCVVTRERDAMAARSKEMHVLVVCSECGTSMPRRFLSAHVARECTSRIVPCKNNAHGCRMRLRWRDRHLHEDFMALASRERSVLKFPIGGQAYIVIQQTSTDLPPPWTLELFVWMANAQEEILDLHARAVELVETLVLKRRELARFTQQSKACKKKLKQLKQIKNPEARAARVSHVLSDVAAQAKTLAEEFHVADTGILETSQAIALAEGQLRILIADAVGLLVQERKRDAEAAAEIQRRVEVQALDRLTSQELLGGEYLSEGEQLRMGDLERWAMAIAPISNDPVATTERQQKDQQQRKLLDKRAVIQQAVSELESQEENGDVTEQEAERLRRRYDRELAKLEAKLSLVSNSTPTVLLDRKGRHVIASSSRGNAIVLCSAGHQRLAYFRGVAGANAKLCPRGEVDLQVSLERNRWHHVAFCASPRELTLVVDGDIKAVKRGVFDLPFARLGSNTADESFQGFLQEVRVWKSCLSKEYLAANANKIVDVQRQHGDLLAYYTFEEGAGDVVDDMALMQPRAACLGTQWLLYNTAAIRQQMGPPPTPSLRDKTSCVINLRLKLLAQRANDRVTEPFSCRQQCGKQLPLRELEIHQRTACENRLVVCSEIGCEKLFRYCDRNRHLAIECERHLYRELLVKQHAEKETLEPCPLQCGESIKRRYTERHYTRECANRLVACPQFDCGESIVAKSLKKHLREECKSAELVAERRMVENARKRQQATNHQN